MNVSTPKRPSPTTAIQSRACAAGWTCQRLVSTTGSRARSRRPRPAAKFFWRESGTILRIPRGPTGNGESMPTLPRSRRSVPQNSCVSGPARRVLWPAIAPIPGHNERRRDSCNEHARPCQAGLHRGPPWREVPRGHHLHPHLARLHLPGDGHRLLLQERRRLVHRRSHAHRAGRRRTQECCRKGWT